MVFYPLLPDSRRLFKIQLLRIVQIGLEHLQLLLRLARETSFVAIEFDDLDLADLDYDALGEVRDLWMRYKVAVFRNQQLTDDALVDFTRRLGPLHIHVRDQYHDEQHTEIMFVSNLQEDAFHS